MSTYIRAKLKNGMYLSAPLLKADVFFGGSDKEVARFDFQNVHFLKEVQRLNKRLKMG